MPLTRLRLLVLGHAEMLTFQLPAVGEVSLGSAPDCDIHVDEPGVAALHARVRIEAGGVSIRDEGSEAGITIGGRRLARGETAPLGVGAVIVLGPVTLALQRSAGSMRLRHIRSQQYFETRLEEQCEDAEHCQSPFAVIRVRFGRTRAEDVEEAFSRCLRVTDLVAMNATDEYALLLVDTSREAALRLHDELRELLTGHAHSDVRIGVAAWPEDGTTPTVLMAAAGEGVRDSVELSMPRSAGAIEALEPLLLRIAPTNANVLILGETGVGKEVLAHRIHELSPRATSSMVCINCAALSETLLESELFGHERGAFTGAVQAKPGLLESAQGSSLFLDEIGELPLGLQAKLLRIVEQRQVTRLGGLRPRSIDVRFIAATNRDLEREVESGRFRADLYFRLNGVSLTLPPLRERQAEIGALAEQFIRQFCQQQGRTNLPRISGGALGALERYGWPGNVRELRNVIERAAMMCPDDLIDLVHLPIEQLSRRAAPSSVPTPLPQSWAAPPVPQMSPGAYRISQPPSSFEQDERARIVRTLEQHAGNQTHAARALGISRRTLIERIERYGIARPRKRNPGTEY